MVIEIVNGKGHRMQVPLWQLPALVAANVEQEKDRIAAIKAAKAAEEAAIKAAEADRQAQEIRLAESLNAPMDLSRPVEF